LIMGDHEGAGVVHGRYSGPAIQIHDGPTPQQVEHAERQAHADALAGRICAAAADAARSQDVLLELLQILDPLAVVGLFHEPWGWPGSVSGSPRL